MPIYVYQCNECAIEWKTNHGMTESVENCTACESQDIFRVPSSFVNLSKAIPTSTKIGEITNDFIKSSKEDLRRQRDEMDEKR